MTSHLVVPLTVREPSASQSLLVMEPVKMTHVQPMFELVDHDRERLSQWLPWVASTLEPEHCQVFVRDGMARRARTTGGGDWALLENGRLAGVLGVHAVSWTHHSTSIGYWIGAHASRRGLMTDAVRRLVAHLFDRGLYRVEIRASIRNGRSRAIPERLSFELEGILRATEWVRGHPEDHAVYGKLAVNWPGIDGPTAT